MMWIALMASMILGAALTLLSLKVVTSLLSDTVSRVISETTNALTTSFRVVLSPGANEQGEIMQPPPNDQQDITGGLPWEMWDPESETRPETVFPPSSTAES